MVAAVGVVMAREAPAMVVVVVVVTAREVMVGAARVPVDAATGAVRERVVEEVMAKVVVVVVAMVAVLMEMIAGQAMLVVVARAGVETAVWAKVGVVKGLVMLAAD